MRRVVLVIISVLTLTTTLALATPIPEAVTGTLMMPPTLDTFDDTIYYDNNQISWWFGGLTSFRLATKFTPLATFELQQFMLALTSQSPTPITLYVKNDSSGLPGGAPLWTGSLVYNTSNTWRGVIIDTLGLPQLTFPAGSNFWLEIASNGPPFEVYDNSPIVPARSKTYYLPFGGWIDSPGDNFIRAVGQYGGAIVDVGIDSIWHGQNFFLPNPGTLSISARIKNYGSAAATFQVACSLFTEQSGPTYPFFQALSPQTITVAPGLSYTLTFTPPVTISTSNRYRIRARTLLTGDNNPDNNTRDTETQVYTTPAELRYDDGVFSSAAYSSSNGDGWAMRFNPNQPGAYNLAQFQIMAEFATGDSAARIQVLDDNGPAGAPNTVLWQTVQTITTGWNGFTPNLTNLTGTFYLAYLFEYGANTSALRMDNYPSSGMAWQKTSGVWSAMPAGDDWMMRATISSGGGPSWDITLTPVSFPIVIPATGGSFNFNATVTNLAGATQTTDAWIMLQLPSMSWYGPVLGPVSLTLPGGGSVTRLRTQNIPGNAPAGLYTYRGYLGTYATSVKIDSSSFTFTKSADLDGGWVGDWGNAGESFEGVMVNYELPVNYWLGEPYPNPFNPETSIEYGLPQAGSVELSVYNVSGVRVKTLVNGWLEAGTHRVIFNAAGMPSGIYLCRMTSGEFASVQKIVLMK